MKNVIDPQVWARENPSLDQNEDYDVVAAEEWHLTSKSGQSIHIKPPRFLRFMPLSLQRRMWNPARRIMLSRTCFFVPNHPNQTSRMISMGEYVLGIESTSTVEFYHTKHISQMFDEARGDQAALFTSLETYGSLDLASASMKAESKESARQKTSTQKDTTTSTASTASTAHSNAQDDHPTTVDFAHKHLKIDAVQTDATQTYWFDIESKLDTLFPIDPSFTMVPSYAPYLQPLERQVYDAMKRNAYPAVGIDFFEHVKNHICKLPKSSKVKAIIERCTSPYVPYLTFEFGREKALAYIQILGAIVISNEQNWRDKEKGSSLLRFWESHLNDKNLTEIQKQRPQLLQSLVYSGQPPKRDVCHLEALAYFSSTWSLCDVHLDDFKFDNIVDIPCPILLQIPERLFQNLSFHSRCVQLVRGCEQTCFLSTEPTMAHAISAISEMFGVPDVCPSTLIRWNWKLALRRENLIYNSTGLVIDLVTVVSSYVCYFPGIAKISRSILNEGSEQRQKTQHPHKPQKRQLPIDPTKTIEKGKSVLESVLNNWSTPKRRELALQVIKEYWRRFEVEIDYFFPHTMVQAVPLQRLPVVESQFRSFDELLHILFPDLEVCRALPRTF